MGARDPVAQEERGGGRALNLKLITGSDRADEKPHPLRKTIPI
jgi:hypothetical protein